MFSQLGVVVVHVTPATQEEEAGGLQVQGQPELDRQDSKLR
jgi:hypothetical protein